MAKLAPVFDGADGTMTAANSTAAHRRRLGGAARDGGMGARARPAGARLVRDGADVAAVDYSEERARAC